MSRVDPYKTQHLACLTFLWMRKIDGNIQKCVDKNIAKKICSMIKVVLTELLVNDKYVELQMLGSNPIWTWTFQIGNNHSSSSCFRPCVCCLRPVTNKDDVRCALTCDRHSSEDHTKCCEIWSYSMSTQCINKFRDRFDFPK
jgi:hypothetical protein